MIRYGKTTQTAIALMSRLAEAYDEGRPLSSLAIARDRDLSQSLVAKLLTVLSQAGLVTGSRGPGGGYRLTQKPRAISLLDITRVFERSKGPFICPFGPGWCGRKEKCPLHDDYAKFVEQFEKHLRASRLDVFVPKKRLIRSGSKSRPGTP
jgi:Rrf2 family iron-sulfur cluster assembly transcriptional regulator